MKTFSELLEELENKFGNKDNVISLGTISQEKSENGLPIPSVRNVNAYYEAGVFYVVTYGNTKKVLEIEKNNNVAFSVAFESFTGSATGKNLGWVLDPKNSELRQKLRKTFADWYDHANNESDKNCCYLALRITKGTIMEGHGEKFYYLDFLSKTLQEKVKL